MQVVICATNLFRLLSSGSRGLRKKTGPDIQLQQWVAIIFISFLLEQKKLQRSNNNHTHVTLTNRLLILLLLISHPPTNQIQCSCLCWYAVHCYSLRIHFQFSLPLYTPVYKNCLPCLSTFSETQIDLSSPVPLTYLLMKKHTCLFHSVLHILWLLFRNDWALAYCASVFLKLYTFGTISRVCPLSSKNSVSNASVAQLTWHKTHSVRGTLVQLLTAVAARFCEMYLIELTDE